MAAMMGGKTISFSHWIRDTDRGGFFRDRKMQHTASGLLPDEQFSDAFFKRSDPSHPPVNLETLLFGGCHSRSSVVLVLGLGLESARGARSGNGLNRLQNSVLGYL